MFWLTAVVTAVWVGLVAWDDGVAAGVFGEKGSRLATTLLMGVLASTAGLLVLHHRGDDREYWSTAELVYALALFVSLFYGAYSFLGWYYA